MQGWMLILSLIYLLMLTACGENQNQQDIKKQVAVIKSQPALPIPALPPVQPMKQAVYQAGNLRDPFQPPKKVVAQDGNRPDLSRKKQPLEAFSLNSLQMVGTIKRGEQFWALIRATDGSIYPITIGQYMGQNYGRVVNVTQDAVILNEKIQINGEWQERKTQLPLKQ